MDRTKTEPTRLFPFTPRTRPPYSPISYTVSSQKIYPDRSAGPLVPETTPIDPQSRHFVLSGLSPNTDYAIRVRANYATGESSPYGPPLVARTLNSDNLREWFSVKYSTF